MFTDVHVLFSYNGMVHEAQDFAYRLEMWDDHDTHVEDDRSVDGSCSGPCRFCRSGSAATLQGHHPSPEDEGTRR
jgi:hypothetical protein